MPTDTAPQGNKSLFNSSVHLVSLWKGRVLPRLFFSESTGRIKVGRGVFRALFRKVLKGAGDFLGSPPRLFYLFKLLTSR